MSTLYVDNLRSNLSTKITVPSGNTLDVSGGTLIPSAGAVVQFKNFVFNGGTSTTTATTFTDTGVTGTITPLYSTSKILVLVTQHVYIGAGSTNRRIDFRCIETGASTEVWRKDYIGGDGTTPSSAIENCAGSGVFDCSDTSALTFKTQVQKAESTASESGAIYYNWYTSSKHTMQLLEIAQ